MSQRGPTREECLQQVRDLEQRLIEAQVTIADLRRRLGAGGATLEAGQQLIEELQTANEELQSQAEELQVQSEELEMQNDELQRVSMDLETERAWLRAVLEQMPAGVIIAAAPSGRFLLVNRQMAAIIGRAVPMAKTLKEYGHYRGLHPDGRPFRPKDYPLAHCLTSGKKTLDEEINFVRADGSPGVLQVSATPVRNARGEIIAGVAINQDITARKQAEREIRRLASFPQLNPNPVLEVNAAGQITYYNEATLKALGGIEVADLRTFLPDDLSDIFATAKRTGQDNFRREVTVNGQVFFEIIFFAEPLNVWRIYAVDITERQRAEEALRESREDLNRAQAVAHAGSWRLNIREGDLAWSDETYRIFGVPPGTTLTYESFLAAVHPEDRAYVDRQWAAALRGEPYDIEHRIVVGDAVKWVSERAELEFDPQGALLSGFGTVQDITERRRAQEELHQSDKHTADILESISDGFLSLNKEMVVTYFNNAAARILGRNRDEVLDQKLFDAFPEARGSIFEEKYAEALREGKSLTFEVFFEAEPYRNWYEVRVFPFQDGISVFFQVTTERKKHEAALLRAKQDWERTFDAVPDLITIMDADHRMVRVNRALARALGKEPKELAGKHCFEFMHESGRIPAICPHQQLLADGREHSAELREMGRDFLVTTSPIFNEDGALFGSVHLARDITERKLAEEALKDSEERFRTMANAIPQLAWTARGDGYIYWYNQRWYDYTGTTPEEMEGWGWQSVHDSKVLPEVLDQWKSSIATGMPFDMVFPLRRRDGQFRQFLTRVMPMKDADGKVIQWFGTNTDITERQQAEAALQKFNAELEQALKETEQRQRETEALQHASRAVMEYRTFKDAAWEIFQDCKAMTRASAGYIALLSPDGAENEVLFLDAGGLPCTVDPDLPMPIRGLREEAYRTGQAVFDNEFAGSRHAAFLPAGHVTLENVLFAPMVHEGKVVGLIGLANKPGGFTAHDVRLAAGFADLAAIALVSHRAEEKLQQAHAELEQRVKERTAELRQTVGQLESEVAERLEAEEALKSERQRFYDVLEMLPAYVALLTPDYYMPYANRFFVERFGESQGKRCFEFLFGRTEPCEICETFKVLKTKAPQQWEWTGPDGRYYEVHDYPFTDVDGSPLVMEMGIDITKRQQAEKQAENLGRLYRVMSRVNEAIVRVPDRETLFRETCRIVVEDGLLRLAWVGLADPDDGVVKVAAQYGHDQGYLDNLLIPLEEVPESRGPTGAAVREGRYDLCNDLAAEPRMAPWRKEALARGYRSSGAFPLRVGSEVVGAITLYAGTPGFFSKAEIDLLEALADDLSFALESMDREVKRRQAEAEVQKLNEELEQRVRERTAQLEAANREMEAFSYSVSHDLKAPIRAIDGFSKMLLAEHAARLDPEGLRLLGVVRHNTGFMAQLIEDLLALSRLGRREIRKARLGLAAMSAAVFQQIKDEAPERRVELTVKDLPPAYGDPSLMRQVLVNLLSNAFKFTKFREDAVIEVGGRSADGENVYYVKDNGVGFDMRYQEKLFGVFQRLHKQGEFEGTGVGLAIVQRILQRHGGRTWAAGKLGEGATFYFALPNRKK